MDYAYSMYHYIDHLLELLPVLLKLLYQKKWSQIE